MSETKFEDTVGAVTRDRLLRSLSRALNKYLYSLQIVIPGLSVSLCEFSVCKFTHDTGIITSVE